MTFTFFFLALANFVTPSLLAKGQIHYSQLPHADLATTSTLCALTFQGILSICSFNFDCSQLWQYTVLFSFACMQERQFERNIWHS